MPHTPGQPGVTAVVHGPTATTGAGRSAASVPGAAERTVIRGSAPGTVRVPQSTTIVHDPGRRTVLVSAVLATAAAGAGAPARVFVEASGPAPW
ncbi:hypothetical protein ACFVTC_15060 [Streptomyces sp. NPDC057950]|uniref:hypothetical protein n=1 Tax=Streptomyces sp. NPDC057950 TaxID=3346288 RepID=UPI0036E87082